MGFTRWIRLFSACYRLAGGVGLIACLKYSLGLMQLQQIDPESSVFSPGGLDG